MSIPPDTKQRGLLIVLVGPAGVGKSTISRRLAEDMNVWYTVSATTRPKPERDAVRLPLNEGLEPPPNERPLVGCYAELGGARNTE